MTQLKMAIWPCASSAWPTTLRREDLAWRATPTPMGFDKLCRRMPGETAPRLFLIAETASR